MTAAKAHSVRTALERLRHASVIEVADEAEVSVTATRKHLYVLFGRGRATVSTGVSFRQTNINNHGWLGDQW